MSTTEKVFAPAKVVKGNYGVKIALEVNKFIDFLNEHKNEKGWINLELKESVKGVKYIELDTWKPTQSETPVIATNSQSDDLPF